MLPRVGLPRVGVMGLRLTSMVVTSCGGGREEEEEAEAVAGFTRFPSPSNIS